MEKLDKSIVKTLYYVCAFLMLLMSVVVTSQVIARYAFGNPFTWSEELARYTFVWMSFLGMAVGIKHGSHIALDILVKKLEGVNRKVLMIINNIFIVVFGGILTFSGFKLVELGTGQTSPSLGLPMEVVYSVLPLSGILLIYFVLNDTILMFKSKEDGL